MSKVILYNYIVLRYNNREELTMSIWEELLNPQQLKAVKDTEGAVLVLAGAGSGKTRVLTYRIAYLISEKNAAPESILALTFTNKAANEMSKRVQDTVGARGVVTSTFHSFCAKVLRTDCEYLGYTKAFSIYDTTDSERVIKRVLVEKHVTDKDAKSRAHSLISLAKNRNLSPSELVEEYPFTRDIDMYAEVYARYDELLKESNAMDFDDLLINVYRLFTNFPGVLEKYQRRFRYVLIDEFQDTNKLQYAIMQLIVLGHGNVFVVGDDDQSIYSWRGADVTNMTGFKKTYPDARIYRLEQNYRSTPEILKVANHVISHNKERFGKNLWTDAESGVRVEINNAYSDRQEAEYVVESMISLMRYNGYKAHDFAILTRINAITRLFEEKLNMYNIPYKVFGGFKFFDRAEIKDMLAYMKVALNPRDTEAMLRIINVPGRGIGDTSINNMLLLAKERGESLHDIVLDIDVRTELSPALRRKVAVFRDLLSDLIQKAGVLAPDEYIRYVLDRAGFDHYYDKDDEEDLGKLQNIEEFISAAREFSVENCGATMHEFVQSVALVSDTDGMDDSDYVTISTVHMAKGLEFPVVFVVGLEEDIFPSARAVREEGGLEEERRIMYVALTRAQQRLYLTSAATRFRFNEVKTNVLSRFLREAMEVCGVEKLREEPTRIAPRYAVDKPVITQKLEVKNADTGIYKLGQKVRHTRFGVGRIVEIKGSGKDCMAAIAFDGLGIKRFAVALAPITIVED